MYKTYDKDGFGFIFCLGQRLGLKLFLGCCISFCFNCGFSPAMEEAPHFKCSHKKQLGLLLSADKEVRKPLPSALFSQTSSFVPWRSKVNFIPSAFSGNRCLDEKCTSSSFRFIAELCLIKPDKCRHCIKKSTVGLEL